LRQFADAIRTAELALDPVSGLARIANRLLTPASSAAS